MDLSCSECRERGTTVEPRIRTMDAPTREFRFGSARLDLARRQLRIGDRPAKIGARAFDVLLALVERRERRGQQERAVRARLARRGRRREQPAGAHLGAAQAARSAGDRDDSRARLSLHGRVDAPSGGPVPVAASEPAAAARQAPAAAATQSAARLEPLLRSRGRRPRRRRAAARPRRWCRSSAPAASARPGSHWRSRARSENASRRRLVGRAGAAERRRAASRGPSPTHSACVPRVTPGARHGGGAAAEPERAAGARQLRAPARRGRRAAFAPCSHGAPALRVAGHQSGGAAQ